MQLQVELTSILIAFAGEASLTNIRAAIKEWQNKLCIVFKERRFEDDYVEFAYEGGWVIDLIKKEHKRRVKEYIPSRPPSGLWTMNHTECFSLENNKRVKRFF